MQRNLTQTLFDLYALADVVEDNGDPSATRAAVAIGANVVPAPELRGMMLEAHGLPGADHLAEIFEPVLFMRRRNLAHPASHGIIDAGLPVERRVDLDETEVGGLAGIVEQHFDDADPL